MNGYLSEYADLIRKMRWSYSRLTSFSQCKYGFYLAYIVKDDDLYLNEGNFWAEAGVLVHEILERFFKKEITQQEAAEYFRDNFWDSICYKVKPEIMQKTYNQCLDFFENADLSWLDNYEILGVEKEIKLTISGYDFIGYIDLLLRDKRDGKIVVLDNKSGEPFFTKSGTVKKSSEHSFYKYEKQMTLYSRGVYEEYGEYPKELVWLHFKSGGALSVVPFDLHKYKDAVQWLIDTIHDVENEDDFQASYEFFYCKNLCGFRDSCEVAQKEKRKSWKKRR